MRTAKVVPKAFTSSLLLVDVALMRAMALPRRVAVVPDSSESRKRLYRGKVADGKWIAGCDEGSESQRRRNLWR